MNKEKAIAALNSLLKLNWARIEGYQAALKVATDADLKILFTQCVQTSEKCVAQLAEEIELHGEAPAADSSAGSKMFKVWMKIKTSLSGNSRDAVLNSCEYGEEVTADAYARMLEKNPGELSMAQLKIVENQHALLKKDRHDIRMLRNNVAVEI